MFRALFVGPGTAVVKFFSNLHTGPSVALRFSLYRTKYSSSFKLEAMAENKNQNQEQNRGGQQSNLGGSQQQRGNQQSTERRGLEEDMQQDVSTGGNQQSGRSGQGLQEDLGSKSGSGHSGGQQGSSGRGNSGSSGGSSLGNR